MGLTLTVMFSDVFQMFFFYQHTQTGLFQTPGLSPTTLPVLYYVEADFCPVLV